MKLLHKNNIIRSRFFALILALTFFSSCATANPTGLMPGILSEKNSFTNTIYYSHEYFSTGQHPFMLYITLSNVADLSVNVRLKNTSNQYDPFNKITLINEKGDVVIWDSPPTTKITNTSGIHQIAEFALSTDEIEALRAFLKISKNITVSLRLESGYDKFKITKKTTSASLDVLQFYANLQNSVVERIKTQSEKDIAAYELLGIPVP